MFMLGQPLSITSDPKETTKCKFLIVLNIDDIAIFVFLILNV